MDCTEKRVAEFLSHRGYHDIVFEPDGNVAPDFLVNKCIAIEVRRLNQNYDRGTRIRGLEEDRIPLSHPTWTAGRDFAIENGRNAGG
jgi:hypothetical protein